MHASYCRDMRLPSTRGALLCNLHILSLKHIHLHCIGQKMSKGDMVSFRRCSMFLASHSMCIPNSFPEDVHFFLNDRNKNECQQVPVWIQSHQIRNADPWHVHVAGVKYTSRTQFKCQVNKVMCKQDKNKKLTN